MVLVYNPRLKGLKLHPKWEGPCKVLSVCDHLLEIEVRSAAKGTLSKWLPRDRLRKVKNGIVQTITEDNTVVNDNDEDVLRISSDDESDDEQAPLPRNTKLRFTTTKDSTELLGKLVLEKNSKMYIDSELTQDFENVYRQ